MENSNFSVLVDFYRIFEDLHRIIGNILGIFDCFCFFTCFHLQHYLLGFLKIPRLTDLSS